MGFLSFCHLQIGFGSDVGAHSTSGEDLVPKQTHEVEENGKFECDGSFVPGDKDVCIHAQISGCVCLCMFVCVGVCTRVCVCVCM